MICLDTNVVIAVLKQDPLHLLDRFTREISEKRIAISSLVLFELYYGAANSGRRDENMARLDLFLGAPIEVLAFEQDDAAEAGEIRAALKQAGTPIGPYDVLIAAQARLRGAVLVTANTSEYSRVPGLRLEDWSA